MPRDMPAPWKNHLWASALPSTLWRSHLMGHGPPGGEGQRLGVPWPPSAPQSTGTCSAQLSSSTLWHYSYSSEPASQNMLPGNADSPLPLPCVLRPLSPPLFRDTRVHPNLSSLPKMLQGCSRSFWPKSWTGIPWSHPRFTASAVKRPEICPSPVLLIPPHPRQEGCLCDLWWSHLALNPGAQ